jgi:sensor histidine kinase regulating citrate/malate metabolism
MNSVYSRLAPRTLRGRLSLVALTTATLLMVILTVAFNTVIRHRLQHQADDELHTRAAAVATTIDTPALLSRLPRPKTKPPSTTGVNGSRVQSFGSACTTSM